MTEHTPKPWRVWDVREGLVITDDTLATRHICEVQGATPEEAAANAEFIVRACNTHDDLVRALEVLVKEVLDAGTDCYFCSADCRKGLDLARAALTKAKKEPKCPGLSGNTPKT